MLKKVIVKDGHVITDFTLDQHIGKYATDDTVDVFEFDDAEARLYNITISRDTAEDPYGAIASGGMSPRLTPHSDPRLRISVERCLEITTQIIKDYCGKIIEKEYPVYKQMNILNRIGYTDADQKKMKDFIKKVRDASNNIEELLANTGTTEDEKRNNIVKFDYRTFISKSLATPAATEGKK